MSKLSLLNPAAFFATVAGVGFIKKAPGTWGSLAGLLVSILLRNHRCFQWGIILGGFFISLWAVQKLIAHQENKDPGYVVIDEFVAQMLVFVLIPLCLLNPIIYVLGFAFFRLFDIFKPWPASYFDQKVHNAFGIMMDDIVAALFSFCILTIIILLSF